MKYHDREEIYKDFHRSKYLQLCIIRFSHIGMIVDEKRIDYIIRRMRDREQDKELNYEIKINRVKRRRMIA